MGNVLQAISREYKKNPVKTIAATIAIMGAITAVMLFTIDQNHSEPPNHQTIVNTVNGTGMINNIASNNQVSYLSPGGEKGSKINQSTVNIIKRANGSSPIQVMGHYESTVASSKGSLMVDGSNSVSSERIEQ